MCRNLSWHGFDTISIQYSIGRDLNPRPSNRKSSTLTTRPYFCPRRATACFPNAGHCSGLVYSPKEFIINEIKGKKTLFSQVSNNNGHLLLADFAFIKIFWIRQSKNCTQQIFFFLVQKYKFTFDYFSMRTTINIFKLKR